MTKEHEKRSVARLLFSPFTHNDRGSSVLKPTHPTYPLTEGLQFISKYVDIVTPAHVLRIMRTPGYNILTPYFGIKPFHGQPERQIEMLYGISNAFSDGEGYPGAARVADNLLTEYSRGAGLTFHSVAPRDQLARVGYWGPPTIEDRAQAVVREAISADKIPVIIAYGGLTSLKAAIENSPIGGQTMLVIPPSDKGVEENLGYKLTRSSGKIDVRPLTQDDFLTDVRVALIDDATKTGTTFNNVGSLFPNAVVSESSLFRT